MKNPTKKHHFVPESYLNFFKSTPLPSQSNDQQSSFLYTLDILKIQEGYKNEKIRFQQPGNICYLEDYYTISQEMITDDDLFHLSGYDKLFVESEVLTILESKYPAIVKHINDHGKLPMEMALDLADFIILMKIRNPVWFETLEKSQHTFINDSLDNIEKKIDQDDLIKGKFARIPDFLKKEIFSGLRDKYIQSKHFAKQLQLTGIINRALYSWQEKELYRKLIADQGWNLLIAPKEGPYFVTTDNPGISIGSDNLVYNTKFTGEFHFIFPLSATLCLIFGQSPDLADFAFSKGFKEKKLLVAQGIPEMVEVINGMTIQIRNKLLIASFPEYLEKIAQENSAAAIKTSK